MHDTFGGVAVSYGGPGAAQAFWVRSEPCQNGRRDTDETDIDCGGACGATCMPTETCAAGTDCQSGTCDAGACAAYPATCQTLHQVATTASDGVYTIDPDGDGGGDPYDVYCDMTSKGGGWTLVTVNGLDGRPATWSGNGYPRPGASGYGSLAYAVEDVASINLGGSGARNYSIAAKSLFEASGREVLGFVGGPTTDYITAILPPGCNYFDGSTICAENTYGPFEVLRSNGTPLSNEAYACTTAHNTGDFGDDPYNEFGLNLLEGLETTTAHCHSTASTLGHQGIGRIYTSYQGYPAMVDYWSYGVHSHWNAGGDFNIAGYLMIR